MTLSLAAIAQFQKTILDYHNKEGRSFPWRKTRLTGGQAPDPYAILVSEVMLQQTQAERVIPKYEAWMKTFPTAESLAKAKVTEVLKLWQGLGYNRRTLNLKRAAEMIVKEYGGVFPKTIEAIDALPGVGPYTAGAIAAFAFDMPSAFIETNIRTVYLHFFCKGKKKVSDTALLIRIERTLPKSNVREWYNALMDYGAMLKKKEGNANVRSAHYAKQSKFRGSRREVRGAILRRAATQHSVSVEDISSKKYSVSEIFAELVKEGFLKKNGHSFTLA